MAVFVLVGVLGLAILVVPNPYAGRGRRDEDVKGGSVLTRETQSRVVATRRESSRFIWNATQRVDSFLIRRVSRFCPAEMHQFVHPTTRVLSATSTRAVRRHDDQLGVSERGRVRLKTPSSPSPHSRGVRRGAGCCARARQPSRHVASSSPAARKGLRTRASRATPADPFPPPTPPVLQTRPPRRTHVPPRAHERGAARSTVAAPPRPPVAPPPGWAGAALPPVAAVAAGLCLLGGDGVPVPERGRGGGREPRRWTWRRARR